MINKNTILIGIAGGTGSGKTSIAKALTSEFGEQEVALIEQDSYYNDISHLSFEERSLNNFDHPKSVDFELMKQHLQRMLNGETVDTPVYDFKRHKRSKEIISIPKHHIIILEGIFALFDKNIRDMMDIKLYVDTPDDIRVMRRMKRDISKRGRSFESVMKQYYETVRPMHIQFVEPTKKYAHIIIPEGGHNTVAIDIIKTKLMMLLLHKKESYK
jgi:uridine kinase